MYSLLWGQSTFRGFLIMKGDSWDRGQVFFFVDIWWYFFFEKRVPNDEVDFLHSEEA